MSPSDQTANVRAASIWCELPPESYGEVWACGGRVSLASVSQPEVDYPGGATDRPWALSAAELFSSGWQPPTCCATILFLSWGSSDKLNSRDDGERSGSSAGRGCPSDSHLLGEPEDPAESCGAGSGSAQLCCDRRCIPSLLWWLKWELGCVPDL